ncbi:hypothetical protein LBMAG56_46120 [Verrucomicrobiota bacterium]|nr:hypothetical protein LBMAG56_46120 [Verrucomicrobiota bacterium]
MANFNKVILAGNLTRDPELRYTPKGTAIAKLGMAINRTWKNEAGETKEEVTFVDVDAFGRSAEVIAQYLKKGRPILVEGRLKLDTWEDKQTNQKKSKLGVILDSFQFLDSGKGGAGGGGGGGGESQGVAEPPRSRPAATARPAAQAAPEPSDGPPPEEDDVPF